MDEFIHLEGYNKIKIFLPKRNFHQCNVIYLNHIIHTDNKYVISTKKYIIRSNLNNNKKKIIAMVLNKKAYIKNINFEKPDHKKFYFAHYYFKS